MTKIKYVTGVTTGNAIEWWPDDFIDLYLEEHLLIPHFRCESCDAIWDKFENCPKCGGEGMPVDVDDIDLIDAHDGFDGTIHLYGDWIKDEDGKFAPDPEGEFAFIYDNNDNYVQVVFSKWVMRTKKCSPCFPGQGDLDSSTGKYDWLMAYCLPPDMVYFDWLEGKVIIKVSELGDKLKELFQNTNSYVTPNRDFVIASDQNDVDKIVEAANSMFPNENDGEPWTFDDIVAEITGQSDWGFADQFGYCDHCYRVVDYYSHLGRDYWIDPNNLDKLCCNCVRDEFPEDYLEAIIDNPDENDEFLGEAKLKELGFRFLEDEDDWKYSTKIDHYKELRKTHKTEEIVFGERDPQRGKHKWTIWVRDVDTGES